MDSDTKYGTLLNAYLCAENKLVKEEVDVDEKFTAWRQQAILIPHLVERGAFQNDFMERHCSRRDCFIDDSEFVKKRLQGVKTLLNKTKQKISPRKITSSDMPDIDKIKFSPKEELLDFTQQDRERSSNPSSSSDISQINVEEEERPRKISRMQAFVQTDSSEKPAFRTALDVFLSQKAKVKNTKKHLIYFQLEIAFAFLQKCDKNDVNSGGEMRRNTGKTDFNLGAPKKSLGTTLGRYANANKKGFVPPLRTTK